MFKQTKNTARTSFERHPGSVIYAVDLLRCITRYGRQSAGARRLHKLDVHFQPLCHLPCHLNAEAPVVAVALQIRKRAIVTHDIHQQHTAPDYLCDFAVKRDAALPLSVLLVSAR